MRNERLKYFTAILSLLTGIIIFYVFAEKKGVFFLTQNALVIISVIVSAFAAFFSLYSSRRLVNRRLSKSIFIIHSHKDKEEARKLVALLKEMGFNPWLDEEQLTPGQNWSKTISQAIENSSVALYLASKNTLETKGAVFNEIKAAREVLRVEKGVHSPVIPVMLEKIELPSYLAEIHAVKLFEENGMEELIKGLHHLLGNNSIQSSELASKS